LLLFVVTKKTILTNLKSIALNTKKQCIDLLNDLSINTKILCFLPKDDKNDMNIEVANEILNLMINFSEKLFCDNNKEECIQFQSKLEECDCYNTLLLLLNSYENILFKVQISIILGNFYKYLDIPNEKKIIINILINYLKERSTKKTNKDENNKLIMNVLSVFINISKGNNKILLVNNEIIPLLFPLVNSPNTILWKKAILLLSNICNTRFIDDINLYVIFDVFHQKLLEISPFPPQNIVSSNYHSISCIILGINGLLIFNRSGVTSFLKTPLIPLLLHTLGSTLSIGNTSSDKEFGKIQLNICKCFLECTKDCYEDTLLLVEMKVIDYLLDIIEMYINEIKNNKILLNEEIVQIISMIFFNTGKHGSKAGSEEEKNKFKNYFDENNRLNKLLNLFEFFVSQTLSPIQKETINYVSITICLLLKNERPPLCYICVLEYVNNLKFSLSPTSFHDFPSAAKNSWNEMLNAKECLWNSFKEIIVVGNFEVSNGVLGLDRDVYLDLVKFLDLLVLRKV
jgi:hypothetical protein